MPAPAPSPVADTPPAADTPSGVNVTTSSPSSSEQNQNSSPQLISLGIWSQLFVAVSSGDLILQSRGMTSTAVLCDDRARRSLSLDFDFFGSGLIWVGVDFVVRLSNSLKSPPFGSAVTCVNLGSVGFEARC